MNFRRVTIVALLVLLFSGAAFAQDWSHWRGPTYNGIAKGPTLVDGFDAKGPKKLWESEPLSTKGGTGYGTVSVADGRAYIYVQTTFPQPVDERTVPRDIQSRLGYVPGMPQELVDAVEKARVSEERTNAKGRGPIRKYIGAWIKENLKKEHKKYQRAVDARLTAGTDAVSLDVIPKLDAVQGKTFPNQAALDEALEDIGLDATGRKQVQRHVPTTKRASEDTLICLDAGTGQSLWRKNIPSWFMWYVSSCTPTVSDGKCYVLSSESKVYCFDAKTGAQAWSSEQVCHPRAKRNSHARSSSVLILNGVAVVTTRSRTSGLDAATGEVLWKNDKVTSEYGSAVPYVSGGKSFAVLIGSGKVAALEPKTGEIAWSVKGGDGSTPTIVGDLMAITTKNKDGKLMLYQLGGEKPELKWAVPFGDQFSAPIIHDGHVYVIGESYAFRGKGRAMCVEIATGSTKWNQVLGPPQHSSPLLADGKIIAVGGDALYYFAADPAKYTELGKTRLGLVKESSVAFADGRIYLHTRKTVACYDLRK